jgi:hypothetical protein
MRRQNIFFAAAAVLLVIAGILFTYNSIVIPKVKQQTEEQIRMQFDDSVMPKRKVAVVEDKGGIRKYTILTDDILSKIKLIDIPEKYAEPDTVSSFEELRNMVALEDLRYGEQISLGSINKDKKQFEDYDRMKEYPIRSIVAGEVKTGNYVDVVVSYNNGDYDVVVAKKKVLKLIETDVDPSKEQVQQEPQKNNPIGAAPSQELNKPQTAQLKEYTMIISVNEEQYRDMELAKQIGSLETRLYFDESQPPSKTTFNYDSAMKESQLKVISEKTLQDLMQVKSEASSQSAPSAVASGQPSAQQQKNTPIPQPPEQQDSNGMVFVRPQN